MTRKVCRDCYPDKESRATARMMGGALVDGRFIRARLAPHPGPRCASHAREETRRRKSAAHERRVTDTYGLAPGDYDKLFRHQGGRCAICTRGKGITKRLAVDHDHACCSGPTSCGKCVRGLVCGRCNSLLAHARDEIEFFQRAQTYLLNPPARQLRSGD